MADFAAIRDGLKANLAAIPGCQVSAYMIANPTPPTIWVARPEETTYDRTMGRGHDDETFVVQAIGGSPYDIAAQKNLDLYASPAGPHSVKAALEADKTLGGAVQSLRVTRRGGYRFTTFPGRDALFLVCEWDVAVLNPGT